MRVRKLVLPLVVLLPTLAVAQGSQAATPVDSSQYGTTLNILPPGSSGNVDAAQLAQLAAGNTAAQPTSLLGNLTGAQAFLTTATATSPTNFADQLEKYDAINTVAPSSLTDASLTSYYKDAALGVKDADVVRTETPRAGTTIKWDKDGVPHVYGDTDDDVAYGAGVVDMEDRMFLTDVLRHTGGASMASFVGATPADISQDSAQLQVAPYTAEQDQAMINNLLATDGDEGRALLAKVNAYLDGINAEIDSLCPFATPTALPDNLGLGFGVNCPVEYAALQRPPAHFTINDVISIASLVGGIFGTGGGGQYTNAIWLQQLTQKFGQAEGTQIYDDLREKDDPETPVTSPDPAPYGTKGPVDPSLPGVAMPDLNPTSTQLATGALVAADGTLSAAPTGAFGSAGDGNTTKPKPTPTTAQTSNHLGVNPAQEASTIEGELAAAQSGQQTGMSNELMVDAKHGEGGHPVAVFGPQTGYYAPQLLIEEELEGPSIAARGVSFAGTNFIVELGHGLDYAWSATSPYTDITDTVVQKLCNSDGSAPTTSSTSYVDENGACVPMVDYTKTEDAFPNVQSPNPPTTLTFLVLRTDHGIVELRTTVKGAPVAIVLERSTYGSEINSIIGFTRLDDPSYVKSPADFYNAVEGIQYTFNWFYVDSTNIAYHLSALLPKRSAGTDLDLPRWGEKAYDWQGYEPFSSLPQTTNPARGYIVNWNDHMAPGFDSSSETWGDGAVYRVLALEDRVKALIASGTPVTEGALTGAMIDAATVDTRGAYDLGLVLDAIGTPPAADTQATAALALLRQWVADGAHRVDRARTGHYTDQAAIDLFDTWWDPQTTGASCAATCGFSLPLDAMSGLLGSAYAATIPEPLNDPPTQHFGSSFNGVVWMGYLSKDLRTLLGRPVAGKYSHVYCGNGVLATCSAALLASLDKAIAAAETTESVTTVGALTYDKTKDDIVSTAGGVTGARPIDWQNRPTFQQVAHYTSHRPLPTAATRPTVSKKKTVVKKATAPKGTLAATGLSTLLPVLAALLLLGGWTLRRRRVS